MKVKLEYYRIFHEVAIQKSFSKASKELFMTQSAVSQAIQQLELALEMKLFFRESRGVRLTPEGELLESYAKHAIASFEKAEQELDNMKNLKMGSLRIGVGDMVAKYFLLEDLEKYATAYPNIKVQLLNRTTPQTLELLKNHEIDIALVNLSQYEKGIVVKKIWTVHDVFVAGNKYRGLSGKTLRLKDMNKYPMIVLDPSTTRTAIESHFAANKAKLNASIEVGSNDLILDLVEKDLGIGVVTKEFSQDYEQRNMVVLDVQPEIGERTIGLCVNKYTELSKTASAFLDFILIDENK